MKRWTDALVCAAFLAMPIACEKTEETTEEAAESESEETASGTLAIGFSETVPKDLAVASLTAQQSDETRQAGQIATNLQGNQGVDYLAKIKKLKEVLAATSREACLGAIPAEFNLAQGNLGHAKCFGPQLDYTNHPDSNESGMIGNGDLGMFWDYAEPDDAEVK